MRSRSEVIKAVNDENISFASLYLLRKDIMGLKLTRQLNSRHKTALEITDAIVLKNFSGSRFFSTENRETTYAVLKWILENGSKDDGIDDKYDKVLDIASSHLVKRYGDKSISNTLIEMIFERHRNGRYKNDLIWILYETRDRSVLGKIAYYLLSREEKDVELARRLLHFIPCIKEGESKLNTELYECSLNWLKDNASFLYYFGESFQQAFDAVPFKVSLEAKYLSIPVNSENGKMLRKLDAEEQKRLEELIQLNENLRMQLADYSYSLYVQNRISWNKWMVYPMHERIRIAGGSQ